MIDWSPFDALPESTCECRCGAVWRSHAKTVVAPLPSWTGSCVVARKSCPGCGRDDDLRSAQPDLNKCDRACLFALDAVRRDKGQMARIDELAALTGYDPKELAVAIKSLIKLGLVEFHPDTPLSDADRRLIYDD